MKTRPFSGALAGGLVGFLLAGAGECGTPDYPGARPGRLHLGVVGTAIVLSNEVVAATWRLDGPGLRREGVRDQQSGRTLTFTGECFQVFLADGRRFEASSLRPTGPPVLRELPPEPRSARQAARVAGREVSVELEARDAPLRFRWRVVGRDDTAYLREELELSAPAADVTLAEIRWLDERLEGTRQAGRVDGSPLVNGTFFLGYEDPMAANAVGGGEQTLGTWEPADLTLGAWRRKTWTLNATHLVAGPNEFRFQYQRGPHRLDLARAVLLENGREVARDEHPGRAGSEQVDHEYVLSLARVEPAARYELAADLGTDPALRLAAGRPVESWGRVQVANRSGPAVCRLVRQATLERGGRLDQSFVIGVVPAGQLRRGFLHYLEHERAHPYRPFLHYNSWYDLAWHPFALNETNCLDAIRTLGERFLRPHEVTLDALVFDDGWDDPRTLWQFHAGFPRGFTPLAGLARDYGTRLGVWLSPFGGYGDPKEQRLRWGRAQGYETNATGFSLAGTRYYSAFKQACVRMIRDHGVNHFKFDGIASGMYANGAGADYILDTEAMRRLMRELRDEDPGLFINLTTGSWPSPFWLRHADSVWRQGGDMGHSGKGNRQQQWLTYRDQEVHRNIVRKGPLFPLSSLMTQGVAYSREGMAGDPTFDSAGFRDDVRAFFGAGTCLQELYIQPSRLTTADWAVLAEAARWSRAHADVLADTHWIGGDPARLEVYGYASWNRRQGIVMLRNPDDQPHPFSLDLGLAFDLPPDAPGRFELASPWADEREQPVRAGTAGTPLRLALQPFQVLVLEATPVPPGP